MSGSAAGSGSGRREEKLDTVVPNPPSITVGEVVVHKPRELFQA
jgi:hypothetical protein